jgi:hypothetical protein
MKLTNVWAAALAAALEWALMPTLLLRWTKTSVAPGVLPAGNGWNE